MKKVRGRNLEQDILQTALAYERKNIARIKKLDVLARYCMNQKTGRLTLVPVKAPFDFYGYLYGSGRFIAIEAKESLIPRLYITWDKNTVNIQKQRIVRSETKGAGLKQHQINALLDAIYFGAAAMVIWRYGDKTKLITPDELEQIGDTKPASIHWDSSGVEIQQGTGFIFLDFLSAFNNWKTHR